MPGARPGQFQYAAGLHLLDELGQGTPDGAGIGAFAAEPDRLFQEIAIQHKIRTSHVYSVPVGRAGFKRREGFVIVDDFKMSGWRGIPGGGWEPFETNMKRVLPAVQFLEIDPAHPIYHTFFEVTTPDDFPQPTTAGSRSSAASSKATIRRSGC